MPHKYIFKRKDRLRRVIGNKNKPACNKKRQGIVNKGFYIFFNLNLIYYVKKETRNNNYLKRYRNPGCNIDMMDTRKNKL